MTAPLNSPLLKILESEAKLAEESFASNCQNWQAFLTKNHLSWPELKYRPQKEAALPLTPQSSVDHQVDDQLELDLHSRDRSQTAKQISLEERMIVLEKARAILDLSPNAADPESILYLEQQLSDLLGLSLTSQLEHHQLVFTTGRMKALSHQKMSQHDNLQAHLNYKEAGIGSTRSSFGWPQTFSHSATNSSEATQVIPEPTSDDYWVSLPLQLLPTWGEQARSIKSWYRNRKVIVINPYDQKAVISQVKDILEPLVNQYQFGGSPAVIRQGQVWSPQALGRVMMLLIDDSTNQVPLGPVNFLIDALKSDF